MESAREIVFWTIVASVVIYDSLLLFSIALPRLRFWPLPPNSSPRHQVMRIAGPLGPLSVAGIFALGPLDWNSFVWLHWSHLAVGGLLFAAGGAFAVWGFFSLGLTASQGLGGPLIERGAYRYSRNPQYVGTIATLVGYGVLCNSSLALLAALLWCSWYLLAPLAEEPWLHEQLGPPFAEYSARVRRYL